MPPPHTASTPQILSDVDDTFICSGAGWIGGSDKRFMGHIVYPGAPQFYLALSRGSKDAMTAEGVIWMSARAAHTPIINLIAGEIDNRHPIGRALVDEGRACGVVGFGTKGGLYGKFRHNMTFSRTSRNALKGEHKFHNFVNYMKLATFVKPSVGVHSSIIPPPPPPSAMSRTTSGIALSEMVRNERRSRMGIFDCNGCECQMGVDETSEKPTGPYIFLGDNGEGDVTTAVRLLNAYSDRVAACFIHDVTGHGFGSNEQAARWVENGKLFYFKTYLGAAVQAYRYGLISRAGLVRVHDHVVGSECMKTGSFADRNDRASRITKTDEGTKSELERPKPLRRVRSTGKDFKLWRGQIEKDMEDFRMAMR